MNAIRQPWDRVSARLGPVGLIAISVLCATLALYAFALRPLEARSAMLLERLEHRGTGGERVSARLTRVASRAGKLAAFYQFFERGEPATDLLARLYAIGNDVGVELRSAEYRLMKSKGRIDQYQIALPVRGNYAQIRSFLENALIAIPVLSLDHVAFRRTRITEAAVEADVRMTLHLLAP